jgi:hypothetical protein
VIEFLSGALVLAYAIAGLHFLQLWRRTADRLFLYFAIAFSLFTLNKVAASFAAMRDETSGYEYLLRVLGFVLILVAILENNIPTRTPKA